MGYVTNQLVAIILGARSASTHSTTARMKWWLAETYVHDSAVDVAKFLEAEQPRTVSGVIEGEALDICQSQHLILE